MQRQPSIRNYAVIRRLRVTCLGAIWQVSDRRSPAGIQLLLIPSRLWAWPRLVARFERLEPSVIRLRTGRVTLLFPQDVTLDSFRTKGDVTRGQVKLDALNGFVMTKRTFKPFFIAIPVVLSCLIVSMQGGHTTQAPLKTIVVSTKPSTCKLIPKPGDSIPQKSLKDGLVRMASVVFKIRKQDSLGGLTRFTLTRKCDGRRVAVQAWNEKNYYLISKVD